MKIIFTIMLNIQIITPLLLYNMYGVRITNKAYQKKLDQSWKILS